MNKKVVKIIAIVAIVAVITSVIIAALHRDNTVVPETSNTSDSLTNTTEGLTTEPESEQTTEPATKKEKNPVEILVNTQNPLPDDWKVDLVNLVNGHQIDRRAYDSLQKMMDDARAQGWNPLICSSYRTMEKQTKLFNNKIQQYKNQGYSDSEAYNAAANWVAVPGTSEHQTGLALDIVTVENQMLDNSQLKSECQLWMMEHCYDYGFILRYPEDKTDITGIDFEPWHYRYVGTEAAKIIQEKGICLEEYAALSIG